MEVGAQAAGSSVLDRAGHAVLQVREVLGDFQGALDHWLELGGFFRRIRVLEIVEGSTVGDGGYKCA